MYGIFAIYHTWILRDMLHYREKFLRALVDRFPFPRFFVKVPTLFSLAEYVHVQNGVVWTHLNNISQIGSFLQVRLNIQNVWHHHLVKSLHKQMFTYFNGWSGLAPCFRNSWARVSWQKHVRKEQGSHGQKTRPYFPWNTVCLIGILIMAYDNPHMTG